MLEGAIAPWDHTGLASDPKRLRKHLISAHHDGHQFAYDFSILRGEPDALLTLRNEVQAILDGDTWRTRWLKDLAVYEGYHQTLLQVLIRALEGDEFLDQDDAQNPDISFEAFIRWCREQPETPWESLTTMGARILQRKHHQNG